MALEREIRLCRLMLGMAEQAVSEIPEDRWTVSHCEGGQTPLWIFAHLAVINDMVVRQFGQEPVLPEDLASRFAPGSPAWDGSDAPMSKEEIYGSFVTATQRLIGLIAEASDESMTRPHGVALFEGTELEDLGDFMAHLLTNHLSLHFGQLSAWRRQEGLPPLL